jgi:hypothetical protein
VAEGAAPPEGESVVTEHERGGGASTSRWSDVKALFVTYRVLYIAVILIGFLGLAVNLVDLGIVTSVWPGSKISPFPEELFLADSEVILAGAAIVAIVIELKRGIDRADSRGVGESRRP